MSKTFQDIVDAVASDIQDTDAEMKSIIGRYVNNRYRMILRTTNFNIVNDGYTITIVAGTQSYDLPSDFGKELYVVFNQRVIERTDFNRLGTDFASSLAESGEPTHYIIFRDESGTNKIYLYKNPNASGTLYIPYTVKVRTDLSDTDEPLNDFADLLEIGATADAWRYKRQFNKARSLDVQFDMELDRYMWDEENQENQTNVFTGNKDDYHRSWIG